MSLNPHGGKLINRRIRNEERNSILKSINDHYSIEIDFEKVVELQNIAFGVYSPLEGFMTSDDYNEVVNNSKLKNGVDWTLPIVLDVSKDVVKNFAKGDDILLKNEGKPVALLNVEDIYSWDREKYANNVYQTLDKNHPGVNKLFNMQDLLVGGKIKFLSDKITKYPEYFLVPEELREKFKQMGWKSIVGFQTRNVPHLGHEYVQKTALSIVDGLLINPVIGKKKPGDFKDGVILDSYNALMENYYVKNHTMLAILQTEMRYAGPKEAVFHAIVRKNLGCTHFIIGRDHAGVGNYYDPFAAQKIFDKFPDLEIQPVFFMSFFFCKKCNAIANDKICPHGDEDHINFAGKIIRKKLSDGEIPPETMMRKEVSQTILKYDNPFV